MLTFAWEALLQILSDLTGKIVLHVVLTADSVTQPTDPIMHWMVFRIGSQKKDLSRAFIMFFQQGLVYYQWFAPPISTNISLLSVSARDCMGYTFICITLYHSFIYLQSMTFILPFFIPHCFHSMLSLISEAQVFSY